MSTLQHVHVGARDPHRFESVITPRDYDALRQLIDRASIELHGRVIWNVNSTASGGGVVELLRTLLAYSRGGGVDARWVVISGEPAFFAITKRIHNQLHGFDSDGRGVDEADRAVYEQTLAANAAELTPLLSPEDVVILHDPQTAGMVDAVLSTGATVIWRCHVGLDRPNAMARQAWEFLRRYMADAQAYIFSRMSFAWDGLDPERTHVIQPSIDAFSPKNADQRREQSLAILSRAGIVAQAVDGDATFTRGDGTPSRVDRPAEVLETVGLNVGDSVVAQISRWDRLKDPLGVMRGFAEHVSNQSAAHLVLAGPAPNGVGDDPEGAAVYAEVAEDWHRLPDSVKRRVHLASLPMADIEENAAIVNALQHYADVVVQKSLAEGFGLTVAEAMWKGRPVVASRIGGIQDQIVDGESGVLISDPRDLAEFGSAVLGLLGDPDRARRIGNAARERVRDQFLGPRHLARYFEVIQRLVTAGA